MKNDSITPLQMMTIILPAFMMGLDFLVMSITLQPMSISLGLSVSSLQWLLTGYAIGTASFYAPGGKLADIIGCRKAFVLGVILFTLSSMFISLSKNLLPLATFRILQGAGGSISVCGSLALISEILPPSERSKPMATVVSVAGVGMAVGPILGGLLIQYFSWQYVFWLNIPIGLLSIFLALKSLPKSSPKIEKAKIDFQGLILFIPGMILLTLVISQGQAWGWLNFNTLILLSIAIVLLSAIVLTKPKVESPLFDIEIFRTKNFTIACSFGFLAYFCLNAWMLIFGIYLQSSKGLSPFDASLYILPFSICFFFSGQLAGQLNKYLGAKSIIKMGCIFLAFGTLLFTSHENSTQYSISLLGFVLVSFGFTFINVAAMPLALKYIPKVKVGTASGKMMTIRWLGGALGSTVCAAIFTIVNQTQDITSGLHITMLLLASLCTIGFVFAYRI